MFNGLVVGVMIGSLMSIMPWELSFLLGLTLLVIWIARRVRHLIGREIGRDVVSAAAACAIMMIAILLPVKQLDGKVGPMQYGQMSLDGLCQALRRDHHVLVSSDYGSRTNIMPSFSTDRAMTRRQVLEKLARDANCDLHIGYCGTGATFLFSAYPAFTRLYGRTAQRDDEPSGQLR